MARPKIHTDAKARARVWAAKQAMRRKNLTPVQRMSEDLSLPEPYSEEELESLGLIRALSEELKRLTGEVNASLKERLTGKAEYSEILRELEVGFTRMELPNH
jgi:AAA+ ATPase superfamily predicted ATPase